MHYYTIHLTPILNMNLISYTEDYYLESAISHMIFASEIENITDTMDKKSVDSLFDHIILFNDKKPSDNLLLLSNCHDFKPGDKILVISDIVTVEIIGRFIREQCELMVKSIKSIVPNGLVAFMFRPYEKENVFLCGTHYKPLLTRTEKTFLQSLRTAQANRELIEKLKTKTASSHKRNIMRKMGMLHTQALLSYINTTSFPHVLAHL